MTSAEEGAGLFNARFYGRKPAWHLLGLVSDRPMSAQDAFTAIGPYDVSLEPLFLKSGAGIPLASIVRHPTPDDPQYHSLGVVKPGYVVLSPQDICEIWDDFVTQPVEAMGSLGKGEYLFITTPLPTFDLQGDEIQNYLLMISPYSGWEALEVRVTSVRTVCVNTMRLARRHSSEVYRVIHRGNVRENLGMWLEDVWGRSTQRVQTLKEIYQTFQKRLLSRVEIDRILDHVYPDTPPPNDVYRPTELMENPPTWKVEQNLAKRSKEAVRRLFEGEGMGSDLPGYQGTAWGLLQADVEWEDYRPTSKYEGAARAILFGDRGLNQSRMFDSLYSLIQRKPK